MNIALDSTVLVYANLPPLHKDKTKYMEWKTLHETAKYLIEDTIKGKHTLIIPFGVLVEVASVISRMTNNSEKGRLVSGKIEKESEIVLFDVDLKDISIDTACALRTRGFDSIIAATARQFNTLLITNDRPFYVKVIKSTLGIDAKLFREMTIDEVRNL